VALAPTANEIKTQLKTLLTPIIATSGTRKAKIFDYMALAFKSEEGEEVAILRSPLDTATTTGGSTVNRVNCLMVSEESFAQELQPAKRDSTLLQTQPRGRAIITRRFRLTYFYQFGVDSENTFSATVELIRTAINDAPKLGFEVAKSGPAGAGEWVSHDGLQMQSMEPEMFGTTAVHVGFGLLTVRLIEGLG
jgi:hypothetical protein